MDLNFLSTRVSFSSEGNVNMDDIYSFRVASNKLIFFLFFFLQIESIVNFLIFTFEILFLETRRKRR